MLADKNDQSVGDLVLATGLKRSSVRRLIRDNDLKPLRKTKAQRVTAAQQASRLQACEAWVGDILAGRLDARKIYFTDEKMFKVGTLYSGGNHNYIIYVEKHVRKYEVPPEQILRGEVSQGGVRVMASLGMCYHGAGTLRFSPLKERINQHTYLDVLENTYNVDCRRFYGVGGDFVFMQDGAGPHRAHRVAAYLEENFPKVWGSGVWPPSSPDLNVLDYFAWGYLQHQVGIAQPRTLDELKVAIVGAVANIPLAMIQAAVENFYARLQLCIEAGGRQFGHMLRKNGKYSLEIDLAAAAMAGLVDDLGSEENDEGAESENEESDSDLAD